MNFDKWTARASQLGNLMSGKIGITEKQEETIAYLESKLASGKQLTANQQIEYTALMSKKLNPDLPKGVQTELRKVYRQEKFARTFMFTNKYIQKGNFEEEAAISLLSFAVGRPLIRYKGDRAYNEFFQGFPDVVEKPKDRPGYDTKCVWDLSTFPWKDDELEDIYEWQNQAYMDLFSRESWVTAKCLVNCNDRVLFNENRKWYYALNQPEDDDPDWIEIQKQIERNMIYDFGKFCNHYPNYSLLMHTPEEWCYDIPEEERIILFTSHRDEEKIKEARERVKMARSYLNDLNKISLKVLEI